MNTRYTIALEKQLECARIGSDLASGRLMAEPPRVRLGESGLKATLLLGEAAAHCQPMYVNAEITGLIGEMELGHVDTPLAPDDAACEAGFVYFDGMQDFRTHPVYHEAVETYGFMWCRLGFEADGYVFAWWSATQASPPSSAPMGTVRVPQATVYQLVRFGDRTVDSIELARTEAHKKGKELDASIFHDAEVMVRRIRCLWAFMGQRIAVRRQEPVDRPLRRRLEREGWRHTPVVEIVELRARDYEGHRDDGYSRETTAPDWSCRWAVREHIRRQWCPSEGIHKPVRVKAHVKGPKDKPLKTATKLLAVVR